MAENLAAAGYHTGFVTDARPYFAPVFNFTRGFRQWEYIPGNGSCTKQGEHSRTIGGWGRPMLSAKRSHRPAASPGD